MAISLFLSVLPLVDLICPGLNADGDAHKLADERHCLGGAGEEQGGYKEEMDRFGQHFDSPHESLAVGPFQY